MKSSQSPLKPGRQARGAAAHRKGHSAEWIAAFWLMLKGYRILAFRLKTPLGEIDILARKGEILAVVEVKRRATMDQALGAIRPSQQQRLMRAAEHLAARHPVWRQLSVRLDLIALAPGSWPRHLRDAWRSEGYRH
jgi:putative endonuclease